MGKKCCSMRALSTSIAVLCVAIGAAVLSGDLELYGRLIFSGGVVQQQASSHTFDTFSLKESLQAVNQRTQGAPAPQQQEEVQDEPIFSQEVLSSRVWKSLAALSSTSQENVDDSTCDGGTQLLVSTTTDYGTAQSIISSENEKLIGQQKPNRVAILNDDYCDCDDGRDEPMTGACDRTMRRGLLAMMRPSRCAFNAVYQARKELHGSRIKDGIPDCCDCADEKGLEPPQPLCKRSCAQERERAVQHLAATKRKLDVGVEECRRRARFGADAFAPAFKALVASREVWLVEAEKFLEREIEERYGDPKSKKRRVKKSVKAEKGRISEEELRSFARMVSAEKLRQEVALKIISTAALGRSMQFYVFAPRLSLLGHSSPPRSSSAEEAAAWESRRARMLPALEHNTTCLSIDRHETQFRGGSADPESYNFTFVVCPFEHMSMQRAGPESELTLLGRYTTSALRAAHPSFDSFFARMRSNEGGGGAAGRDAEMEADDVFFTMQWINMRPTAFNQSHLRIPSKNTLEQMESSASVALHPFDYDLYSGPSVTNATIWMLHGEDCWNGPRRHVRIAVVCGPRDALIDVHENGKCAYESLISTPSACCRGTGAEDLEPVVAAQLKYVESALRELRN